MTDAVTFWVVVVVWGLIGITLAVMTIQMRVERKEMEMRLARLIAKRKERDRLPW